MSKQTAQCRAREKRQGEPIRVGGAGGGNTPAPVAKWKTWPTCDEQLRAYLRRGQRFRWSCRDQEAAY